jgi:RNA polymerase sigma-70 factor, ECF subfamily
MYSSLDDEKLATMARDGDSGAFETLTRRWERKLFALCYGIMGTPEDAQDAVQEAFASAFKTIGSFRGEAKFSSWMHRIAVNACITLKRRSKRRAESPLENSEGTLWEPAAIGDSADPLGTLEKRELSTLVRRAVSSLPEDIKEAVVMKEFQNLTFFEIAETLGIPVSTAKSRVYTGMKLLRGKLASRGFGKLEGGS